MHPDDLVAVFDRQAERYDEQWGAMAPIRDALYGLVEAAFVGLPDEARILCVGVGTGAELIHLARRHPGWRFTAVEPSGAMLDVCRRRAEAEGILSRCTFHEGYLDALSPGDEHHAATCFLVSHFLVDRKARVGLFRTIAERLRPGGRLASADLASGASPGDEEVLLRAWLTVMAGAPVSDERVELARAAHARDVAVHPPPEVASVIEAGGFEPPVQIFQAGMLHAWVARRRAVLGSVGPPV